MTKKYNEDDDLKRLVEEQFIKEAEMMEEALFSDKDFEDYEMTDKEVEASYQDFLKRLEEKQEKIRPEAEKILPLSRKVKKRRIPVAKVAGIAVLCVISIFAASMTGEANRRYVINSVRYLVGDDTRIVVDNDEENELPETDEYEAIADIEETLGVEVPEFMYRPTGLEFKNYNIEKEAGSAWIEYNFNNYIIVLDIDQEKEDSSSVIDSMHGKEYDTINISRENIDVIVKKIQDKEDLFPCFYARWKRNDVIYQFSGKMDKELFYKIIEKIKY